MGDMKAFWREGHAIGMMSMFTSRALLATSTTPLVLFRFSKVPMKRYKRLETCWSLDYNG